MIDVWCDEFVEVGSDSEIRMSGRENEKKQAYIAHIKFGFPKHWLAMERNIPSLVAGGGNGLYRIDGVLGRFRQVWICHKDDINQTGRKREMETRARKRK